MKRVDLLLLTTTTILFGVVFGLVGLSPTPVNAITCTPKAKKECISNIVYWYNSCNVLENLYQNCNTTNQICQSGQCVNKPAVNNPSPNPTLITSPNPGSQNPPKNSGLSISILATKEGDNAGWQKTINANGGDLLNIFLVIKNYSNTPINNVTLTNTIPSDVLITSNVKINNVPLSGFLANSINLGTLEAKDSNVISFTGQAQPQSTPKLSQISASITGSTNAQDSDSITLTIAMATTPNASATAAAALTNNKPSNSFLGLALKNWYIWLAVIVVLTTIFIIIFRRLSHST